MTKPKYFIFLTVTTAIMLFIQGNWAISAQAVNGIIDATATPTVIPIGTPNTPLGKSPSAEEQEEIKTVIQSYIEIRYRALSISDAEDYRQNGFDSLILEIPEAVGFLREEIGKLAVEIKHAQLNHLRYVNYKVFLDFKHITVDPSTQTATILVNEGNEVVYEISAEHNPENPIISYTAGIEHTIVLHKKQGQWKIVSDIYNDNLWKILRQAGTSTDEILRATEGMTRTMKAAPRPSLKASNAETAPAYVMLDDPSSHPYDRAGAVEYALQHWSRSQYNPNYYSFGKDCQNFVSQALYEGGNVTMFIPYPNNLQPGGGGWYYFDYLNTDVNHAAAAWTEVDFFYWRTSQFGPNGQLPETWRPEYNQGPEGRELVSVNNEVPAELTLGDVIQYDWKDPNTLTWDGKFDHSAIVVGFDNELLPYVATHTDDHGWVPYTLGSEAHYRFIHIERSNGYPPVKTEITSPADDAGGNPANPCLNTNMDPGNNYFGRCFNGGSITSGFLFRNVQIPQNAQIKYAYVTFTTDGTYNAVNVPISLQISGETNVPPANFTSTNTPAHRTNLTASIPWVIDGKINGVLDNNKTLYDTWTWRGKRTTPDIAPIIQSVVDLPGWDNQYLLSLIFKNSGLNVRRVLAKEFLSGNNNYLSARLIAAYSLGDAATLPPSVISIARASANPTNAYNVSFTVAFSESVTGVDTTDFSLTTTGISGAYVQGISGSENSYTVYVYTGTGDGTLRLNVVDNDTIVDNAGNKLGGTGVGNGNYNGGETYTIDKAPTVTSSLRTNPSPTSATSVQFTITFPESVTGVDVSDFSLTTSRVSGATVSSVSGSGSTRTVTVNTGSGNGSIRLNLVDNNSIVDASNNPLGGPAVGDGNFTAGQAYTVIKSATFADVPITYWANLYIEQAYNAGITSGCTTSPLNYCPENMVTRAQIAVFLLKGVHGSGYVPPAVGSSTGFADVATTYWAAAWIKQLAVEGITGGCGSGNYCPEGNVTRAQMAVFLLKANHGSAYVPPAATGLFTDVPVGYWARNWIEQLAVEGITGGCGGGNYCPEANVSRAQMAIFLVKTFNLP